MPVEVTLQTSPEDAERLVKAFKDGNLAELGVTEVTITDTSISGGPAKTWTTLESDRRDSPNQDIPPRK
jgi:hypothetical protein